MSLLDVKVIKNEPIDEAKEVILKITEDGRGERVYIQFNSSNPRLCIQKQFQNTFSGRDKADAFASSITCLADMKAYFKIKE